MEEQVGPAAVVFGGSSLAAMLERLEGEAGQWAGQQRNLLARACPVSLLVTLR